MGKGELACRPLFQAHALFQCQCIHAYHPARYRACLVPQCYSDIMMGISIPKTLVIWASLSHIPWRFGLGLGFQGMPLSLSYLHNRSQRIGCNIKHFTFFHFPDSGLYLLNGFDFILIYFEWRDTENQQYLGIGPWFFYGDQPLCYSHTNAWLIYSLCATEAF